MNDGFGLLDLLTINNSDSIIVHSISSVRLLVQVETKLSKLWHLVLLLNNLFNFIFLSKVDEKYLTES